MNEQALFLFQTSMFGQGGVGKSRLLLRFPDDVNDDLSLLKEGVGTTAVRTEMVEGKAMKLQVWEASPSGWEKAYIQHAHGLALVYDVTDRESFQVVRSQLEVSEKSVHNKEKYKILVGNKIDILHARQVSTEEGRALAERFQIPFFETSAKEGTNVENVFHAMAADPKEKFGGPEILVSLKSHELLAPSSPVTRGYII